MSQIGPKWDKSLTFSDTISVHFFIMYWIIIWNSRIYPIWGQCDSFWGKSASRGQQQSWETHLRELGFYQISRDFRIITWNNVFSQCLIIEANHYIETCVSSVGRNGFVTRFCVLFSSVSQMHPTGDANSFSSSEKEINSFTNNWVLVCCCF